MACFRGRGLNKGRGLNEGAWFIEGGVASRQRGWGMGAGTNREWKRGRGQMQKGRGQHQGGVAYIVGVVYGRGCGQKTKGAGLPAGLMGLETRQKRKRRCGLNEGGVAYV